MIAMSLHRLNNIDVLQNKRDLYEVHMNTLSTIIRKSDRVVKKHFQLVFMQTPDESQFQILASRFE